MPKTIIEKIQLYVKHPDGPVEMLYYPTSHAYKVNGDKKMGVSSVPDIIDKPGLRHYYMNEAIGEIKRSIFLQPNDFTNYNTGFYTMWSDIESRAKVAHQVKSTRGKENGTRIHLWLENFLIAKRDNLPVPALPVPRAVKAESQCTSWEDALQNEIDHEWNNLIEALSQFIHWYNNHNIEIVAFEQIIYSRQYDYAGRFDAILRIDGKLYLVDFKTNNPTSDYPDGIFPDMFCQIGGYDVGWVEEHYPELHKQNKSIFDGHAVFNFSKKTGKFNKRFVGEEEVRVNRNWFVHTLGTKRGEQYHVRKMSKRYKENRSK
jgi:hypothetical protein